MEAGKLRNRISIQIKSVTFNSYHEPIESWSHDRYLWSDAITGGGKEFYAAQKLHSETSVVFKVRKEYDEIINTKNQIVWDGRTFQILSIDNGGGAQRFLLIATKEVV
jgi:SPP1 family predicted phage head-tail adaptor